MTGSSEGRQSLYAPNAVTSNRSSSRSTSGGLSRAASSFEQIAPVERSRPRPNPSSQKPRLPPIRQESLNTTQRHSAEDRRSRILDGGRGRRKVLAGGSATAAVADESPRRAIASRFASEAAREGAAAERADAKLRSAVDKAETLLGSERGEDEQMVSEALAALRAAEAEAEAARETARSAVVKAEIELDLALEEEEEMRRRAKLASSVDRKKKRGKVATACATLCLLSWICLVFLSIFIGTGYDRYIVNEVDYWYPIRLCRRGPGNHTPAFDEFDATMQVGVDTPTCQAVTQLTRCEGFPCDANGCNLQPLTAAQCSSCCGGTLRPVLSPCQFPFIVSGALTSKCVPSAAIPGAPAPNGSHWCSDGDDAFGRCDHACAQADYVGAQPSACGENGFSCAADGSEPSNVTIQISRSGYGGDAGFRVGAEYTLVLFGAADRLQTSARLTAATGEVLYDGEFDTSQCDGGRRRLGCTSTAEGVHVGGGLLSPQARGRRTLEVGGPNRSPFSARAGGRRRLEGLRLVTWWTELTGYVNLAWERRRFGADARWGGDQTPAVEPVQSEDALCVRNAVAYGTNIAVQRSAPKTGSADGEMEQCFGAVQPNSQAYFGGSGEASIGWDTLRAELGSPFELRAEHFPLKLEVSGARASVRGREAAGSTLEGIPPELYFSFYTEEFDYSARSGMWVGLPLGIVLGSCCCCCLLKCLFRKPRKAKNKGGAGMVTDVGRESQMTDLGPYGHDAELST